MVKNKVKMGRDVVYPTQLHHVGWIDKGNPIKLENIIN